LYRVCCIIFYNNLYPFRIDPVLLLKWYKKGKKKGKKTGCGQPEWMDGDVVYGFFTGFLAFHHAAGRVPVSMDGILTFAA
jgi:hypothetical protein